MRKLLAYCAALSLAATAGCTVHQDGPPSIGGPSTNAISLKVTATPDTLPQNGTATSRVVVQAFNAGGQPLPNLPVRLEMQINGVTRDLGTLSTRNIVTGADGTASATYTAPAGTNNGGLGTTIALVATQMSGDAVNQGILNSVGAISQAYVRLVADGLVNPAPPETPTAQFTVSSSTPRVGQTVLFNGSTSCPGSLSGTACAASNTTLTAWDWDFGDATAHGSGSVATHVYQNPGPYAVRLVVTNGQGNLSAAAVTVVTASINTVANPVAVLTTTVDGAAKAVSADGSRSTGNIVNYLFNWGDGTSTGGTNPIATHAYAVSGQKNVTLTVTDVNGNSNAANVTIVIP